MNLTVLHTESSLGWGGQENRTLNEMIGMRARGHRCLLACQPGARLGERAREAGFDVTEMAMRHALDLPGLMALRRLMAREGVRIVNTHSGRDTQVAGLAARSLRHRPRIVRTRHLALPISSRFGYVTLPDHVVTVSQFVADYLASAGVPRARLTAVPTGVDLARYQRNPDGGTLRAELGLAPETPLVGTVAILRFKKGHADLIGAVPTVLQRFPDAHFVLAGDGPQRDNLERLIAERDLGRRVHLLGLRRDVNNVLQSLDLFVLPTHQEALGTAFIEAAALGVATIGSRVDGVPEAIADGETGLLVPAQDSPALAEAIMALLADPVRRKAMGDAGRRRVETGFSREAMARAMEALYLRLLQQPT